MPISKSTGSSPVETAPAPVSRKLDTGVIAQPENGARTYDEAKNRRILVQGLTQAVAQSMSLAGLGHVTEKDIVASIKSVTRELITFVEQESK